MFKTNSDNKLLVFLHFKALIVPIVVILAAGSIVVAQETGDSTPTVKPSPASSPVPNANAAASATTTNNKNLTSADLNAPQIAESVIFIYGGGLGRINLDQIRKTTFERGKLNITDAAGKTEQAKYERWVQRGEDLGKDKVRFDKEFPNAKFALISRGDKIFGIYNNQVFTPTEDAVEEFQHRIVHGIEGLLRYKENGSDVELVGREKVMGVEYNVVDVTDKEKRKTRYYISLKSFRIMMLEFKENNISYLRKFYDYNYAQGTLVPYRTVLWADGKKVEEMNIQTITFGQKVEDDLFGDQ